MRCWHPSHVTWSRDFTHLLLCTFFTPNWHFFTWFRHVSIYFVTLSLVVNRGNQYEQLHCFYWTHSVSLGSYTRQKAFEVGRVSALLKMNVRCRLHDPSRTVVHYVKQVCHCRKRLPRFQTNVRVTKPIEMCRNQMKRCRLDVKTGVLQL